MALRSEVQLSGDSTEIAVYLLYFSLAATKPMSANSRLVSIAGPLKDATFTLHEEDFSIGRDPTNNLVLEDSAVSRRHCTIASDAGEFKISDLNSRNGTSINGVPPKQRILHDGDQIKVGRSIFVFLLHETENAASRAVELENRDWSSPAAAELKPEDTTYLKLPSAAAAQ